MATGIDKEETRSTSIGRVSTTFYVAKRKIAKEMNPCQVLRTRPIRVHRAARFFSSR